MNQSEQIQLNTEKIDLKELILELNHHVRNLATANPSLVDNYLEAIDNNEFNPEESREELEKDTKNHTVSIRLNLPKIDETYANLLKDFCDTAEAIPEKFTKENLKEYKKNLQEKYKITNDIIEEEKKLKETLNISVKNIVNSNCPLVEQFIEDIKNDKFNSEESKNKLLATAQKNNAKIKAEFKIIKPNYVDRLNEFCRIAESVPEELDTQSMTKYASDLNEAFENIQIILSDIALIQLISKK